MSLLTTTKMLRKTVRGLSQFVVGSAIGGAIALSVSTIVYAQSVYAQSESLMTEDAAVEQVSAESSVSVAEKVARLEAAIATLDSYYVGAYAEHNRVRALSRFAQSYSELGEQRRAVALLEQAVEIGVSMETNAAPGLLQVVLTYLEIGEAEAAEALLAQTVALSDMGETYSLIDIAEACRAAEDFGLAAFTLSVAIDLLGGPLDWERLDYSSRSVFRNLGLIAEAYGELADDDAVSLAVSGEIEAGVFRLVALAEAGMAVYGVEDDSSALATTLSQLAVAQAKQEDVSAAERLAAQAMALVRDGDETGDVTAAVARAYGYVADNATAERALAELMQLTLRDLSVGDLLGVARALGEIAIAYEQVGNQAQSDQALLTLSENFDDLYGLVWLTSIHREMGNEVEAEAVIQQMFDRLPPLEEMAEEMAEEPTDSMAVSDAPFDYSEFGTGLFYGYIHTADDAVALERLAVLERFLKAVTLHRGGVAFQLVDLAGAAVKRGDEVSAQRLLLEAVSALDADTRLDEDLYFASTMMNAIAFGYGALEDDRARQAGLDNLQQIADDYFSDVRLDLTVEPTLEPTLREQMNNVIIHARVGR